MNMRAPYEYEDHDDVSTVEGSASGHTMFGTRNLMDESSFYPEEDDDASFYPNAESFDDSFLTDDDYSNYDYDGRSVIGAAESYDLMKQAEEVMQQSRSKESAEEAKESEGVSHVMIHESCGYKKLTVDHQLDKGIPYSSSSLANSEVGPGDGSFHVIIRSSSPAGGDVINDFVTASPTPTSISVPDPAPAAEDRSRTSSEPVSPTRAPKQRRKMGNLIRMPAIASFIGNRNKGAQSLAPPSEQDEDAKQEPEVPERKIMNDNVSILNDSLSFDSAVEVVHKKAASPAEGESVAAAPIMPVHLPVVTSNGVELETPWNSGALQSSKITSANQSTAAPIMPGHLPVVTSNGVELETPWNSGALQSSKITSANQSTAGSKRRTSSKRGGISSSKREERMSKSIAERAERLNGEDKTIEKAERSSTKREPKNQSGKKIRKTSENKPEKNIDKALNSKCMDVASVSSRRSNTSRKSMSSFKSFTSRKSLGSVKSTGSSRSMASRFSLGRLRGSKDKRTDSDNVSTTSSRRSLASRISMKSIRSLLSFRRKKKSDTSSDVDDGKERKRFFGRSILKAKSRDVEQDDGPTNMCIFVTDSCYFFQCFTEPEPEYHPKIKRRRRIAFRGQ